MQFHWSGDMAFGGLLCSAKNAMLLCGNKVQFVLVTS